MPGDEESAIGSLSVVRCRCPLPLSFRGASSRRATRNPPARQRRLGERREGDGRAGIPGPEPVLRHISGQHYGIQEYELHGRRSAQRRFVERRAGRAARPSSTGAMGSEGAPSALARGRPTVTVTSTRDPSRLMIDMSRSTVKRPRSALRIREKSAASNPRARMRPADAEPLPVESLDDLGGQDGPELPDISVGEPEVAEDVAAPPHQLQLLAHRSIPLRTLRRALTSSMSCAGVLMPFFDFFWNAWITQTASASCTA